MRSQRSILIVLVLSLFASLNAQDEPKPEKTKGFEEAMKAWKDADAKLTAKAEEFEKAEGDAQKAIRDEYTVLVNESNTALSDLEKACLTKYASAPNKDEEVTRLLVGMMVNHIYFENDVRLFEIADALIKGGCDQKHFKALRDSNRLSVLDMQYVDEIDKRVADAKKGDLPQVKLTMEKGEVLLELFEDQAPNAVANFVSLVEKGFYDGLTFHRVLKDFVAQGGCPKGDGTGDPGYEIKCECTRPDARHHYTGSISMAHGGVDTGGSQFFICFTRKRTSILDRRHTVFGRVIGGMDVVNGITLRDPKKAEDLKITPDKIVKAEVVRKRDHEYKPEKK